MQKIEGHYAEAFNARYRRVGHLFEGRFKAQRIDSESYLLTVARTIVLNPVRARIVSRAIDWPWSSCAATAGLVPVRSWLTIATLLDRFDPFDRDHARAETVRFVEDVAAGAKRPWDDRVVSSTSAGVHRTRSGTPRGAPPLDRASCRAALPVPCTAR